MERLTAGLDRKLTLVSAPAGFGKTTLLSEWVHSGDRSETCPYVAWVSLDKGDNDLARLWAYFIAALQTVQAEIGETALVALGSRHPPPVEAILTGLINEIAKVPTPFVLVWEWSRRSVYFGEGMAGCFAGSLSQLVRPQLFLGSHLAFVAVFCRHWGRAILL